MPNKKLEKSNNVWRDMDQFSRSMLSGEYASTSDNLGYLLPPIHEENNHEEEALASAPEEKNDSADDASKPVRPRSSSSFNPNLPTISEEQAEAAALASTLPSGEEDQEDAEDSESKDNEDMFPFPLDICIYLEQRCAVTKRMYSKYVSDAEIRQIEIIYSGMKSSVKVCSSAATLHLCTKNQMWMEQFYGVPVVVVDFQGPTSKLWIYLAERGTGLPLWRETVDWRSAYTRETSTYHVMYVANSRCEKMGLNFDCETAATAFWVHISRLTTQLESLGAAPTPPPGGDAQPSTSSLDKQNISLPCYFEHLTSLSPEDCDRFLSLQYCLCQYHGHEEEDGNEEEDENEDEDGNEEEEGNEEEDENEGEDGNEEEEGNEEEDENEENDENANIVPK